MTQDGLSAHLVVRRDGFDLDIEIEAGSGETVALLGPNGAGKTTAVDALAGMIPLDGGHIVLGGEALDDPGAGVFVPPDQRGIGVVFQDLLLFPHLDALDNVAFGPRSRGQSTAEARRVALGWLTRLGVGEAGSRPPGDLSGGEAQRVALARALAVEPRLLLLDEPLSSLDVSARAALRRLLSSHLSEFQGPRLLVTHEPVEAFLLADRMVLLEGGRVTQSGTADEIRLRPETKYAADLAGTNLIHGIGEGGRVDVGALVLQVPDPVPDGPVMLTIQPSAVSLHTGPPGGSPRNSWRTDVVRVERLGSRARLRLGPPVPLTVELTGEAVDELGIEEGRMVWAAVKATEIATLPRMGDDA